jgi:hypothetical protein
MASGKGNLGIGARGEIRGNMPPKRAVAAQNQHVALVYHGLFIMGATSTAGLGASEPASLICVQP